MSHSSWQEVLEICEAWGIPRDRMPDFSRYECGIDLPLDEILERNRELPRLLDRLPAGVVSGHHWLQVIVSCVRRGELIFFSD